MINANSYLNNGKIRDANAIADKNSPHEGKGHLDAQSCSSFQADIRSVKQLRLEFPDSCEKCV